MFRGCHNSDISGLEFNSKPTKFNQLSGWFILSASNTYLYYAGLGFNPKPAAGMDVTHPHSGKSVTKDRKEYI
jgi:hypothetical protein